MKATERRLARLVRLYPRSYRERRGDEIVATLSANAIAGKLPAREVFGILRHAAGLRIRELRPATLVVGLALVGAGLGAGASALSSPSGYSASERLTPIRGDNVTVFRTWTTELDQLLAEPVTARLALGDLGQPRPVCAASAGASGIELSCSGARDAAAARTALRSTTAVLQREIASRRFTAANNELRRVERVHLARQVQVSILTEQLFRLSKKSPLYIPVKVSLHRATISLSRIIRTENKLVFSAFRRWSAPTFAVTPATVQALYGPSTPAISIGASVGLILGLLGASARSRRRPQRPITAS